MNYGMCATKCYVPVMKRCFFVLRDEIDLSYALFSCGGIGIIRQVLINSSIKAVTVPGLLVVSSI